ncbi:glycosyltransferase [bacterium]|nr:glycosyltransferase [bacterium]
MQVVIDARTTQDEVKFNGIGRYSRFIIEYLIKLNPNTHFILLMYDGPSTIDGLLNRSVRNIEVKRMGKHYNGSGLELIRHNLDLFFHVGLNRVLRKIKKDNAVFFSPYFWRGIPVFKLPTVLLIHDFALPKFHSYSTISPVHNILRAIHYWFELYRVLWAKKVICNSQNTYKDFLEYFSKFDKSKVEEVLLGVEEDDIGSQEVDKYLPSDWQKRGYLLYMGGGLTKNKNSEGVVSGFAQFIKRLEAEGKSRNECPYLVIAGKNFKDEVVADAVKFRSYVESKGVADLVHYAGFYEDVHRWPLMRKAFGFIHLSLFEGFGFAVAEAMRAGVPVIAHNGSTYPQVVGDGGLLVNGEDFEAVGQGIYKIYSDKEFARSLGKKGLAKSLEYNWIKTAKKTYNILEESLDGNIK